MRSKGQGRSLASLPWRSREVLHHRGPDGYGRWLSTAEPSSDCAEPVELNIGAWRFAILAPLALNRWPTTTACWSTRAKSTTAPN